MRVESEITVVRKGVEYAVDVWGELTVVDDEINNITDFGFECQDLPDLVLEEHEKNLAYAELEERFDWDEWKIYYEPEYDPDEE